MKYSRLMIMAFAAMSSVCSFAAEADSTENKIFSGSAYTEVNYGHKSYGEERTLWDFPHIVLSGELQLGKGWSVAAEFEYERFYDEGEWGNNFGDNFATNFFYVNKSFSDALNVKAGIIGAPVGLTNIGGPALTIYDPESEAAIVPMTWHESGISLWGELGKWSYELAALAYFDAPFKNSKVLGAAARINRHDIIDGLRVGLSGYWGTSSCGMVGFGKPGDFIGDNGLAYAGFDFDYDSNGWIVDGSALFCTDNDAKTAGVEAGYDFAGLIEPISGKMQIMPFVRYDGVFTDVRMNKLTAGVNISPLKNLVIKAEFGRRKFCGGDIERTFDVGVGYSIDF